MDAHRTETPVVAPLEEWSDVTLHLSASDARRIVRALEQTSVRLSGSPSGAGVASSYIRLAGIVRRQAAG